MNQMLNPVKNIIMKKITMILLALLFIGGVSAQNQKEIIETEEVNKTLTKSNTPGEYTTVKKAGSSKATTIWSEDFSGGALPIGWLNTDSVGNGQVWTFEDNTYMTVNTTTGANGYAILDSDAYGSGSGQNSTLITETIDLSTNPTVTVEFEHYYRDYLSEVAKFLYSIDDGATWTVYQTWTGTSTTNAALFSEDMSAELGGESTVKLAWDYEGSWGYYWAVDDIIISEPDPYEFALTIPSNADVAVGASHDYLVTIDNIGTNNDTYDLTFGGGGAWTYEFYNAAGDATITNIQVDAGTTADFNVRVTIPGGTADGETDTENIAVTSQNDGTVTDNFDITTTAVGPIVPPYTEDFENAGTIPDKWVNSADDNADWQFLTGAIGHGATQDHTSGAGYYAAIDDSSPNDDGNEMILISPPIDLASSGFTYPVVEFWYMNTDNTSAPMTELYVEGWNGSSWDQLMLIDEPFDAWTKFTVKIDGYLAMSDFKVRFRATTTESFYSDPSLDDVSFIEGVANDLGVEEILPHAVVSGNTVTPIVKVHNYGFTDVTDYTIVLNDGTSDISTVNVTTTLPEDGETYIDMDPWTPADASYTLTATVTLNTPSPDGNAANDILDQACEVKAFTYNAGQILAYNTFADEVVDVDHSAGTITTLMASNTSNFLTGGDLVGNEVYGIEYGSNDIYIVDGDGSNYKIGTVGGVSEGILGIADDITGKGTLYAAVSDGATGTDLYTIDANWDATLVGSIVADQTIIGLACNSAGDLYGIALGDDNLYSIDKATGAGTVVGPLGIDIDYAQDIGFDRGNDFLYGTLYTTTGKLYTIDVNSGEALEIGTFTDELTMCAVYTSETLVAGTSDTWGNEFGATTSMTNIIIPDGIEITVSDAKATQACNVLTIQPGGMLTVNGTLNVSNDMIIESDATKNGSLILNTATGAITVSNNTRVQQYLPENTQTYNWHYMSMPIASATADVFPGVDPGSGNVTYAATWDEAADGWSYLANTTDALSPLVGYAVPLDVATTIEFSGADLITGNQTTPALSYTAGGTYAGFHLVGTPYTSAYDVSIADAITGTNWTSDVWVRNDGNFETHNIAGATGTLTGNVIPAMQGFWIRGDGVGDMDITFDIANQVHSGANTVYKEWINEVHLSVTNGELDDELVVYFNDNATGSFEKFDSEKRFAASDLYPQIYTVAEGYKLAINGLAAGKEEYVVPVGFQANNAGTFTFSALNVDEFDAAFNVYLVDNETNETIDLRKEGYTFETTDALNNAGRFELVLTQGTTGIEDVADNFNVFTNNNVLYMNSNVSGNAHIRVTDILGRVAQEELIELNQGMNSFELNTTNGVYVVTVKCNNKVYTEKVVIK